MEDTGAGHRAVGVHMGGVDPGHLQQGRHLVGVPHPALHLLQLVVEVGHGVGPGVEPGQGGHTQPGVGGQHQSGQA